MTDSTLEAIWHNDGHSVALNIEKTQVVVEPIVCPHDDAGDAACFHPKVGCLFVYFVGLYGLEVNNGQAPAASRVDMAWAVIGDRLDLEACQLWTIPVDDPLFAAWSVV